MSDPRSSSVTDAVWRAADYLYVEMEKLDAPITMTACLVLAKHILGNAQRPSMWRDNFENAPTEMHDYFLVRPKGLHPSRGGLFLPTIVQRIDGEFYATDNELEPIYFGQNEADGHPLKTTLEWQPLPADWTCSVSSTDQKAAAEMHASGRTKAGNDIRGI